MPNNFTTIAICSPDRRPFLAAALAWLFRPAPSAPSPKPVYPAGDPRKIQNPWWDESERRHAADPHNWYSDYEAFDSWLDQMQQEHPFAAEWTESLGLLERVDLYAFVNLAIEQSRIAATTEAK